MIYLFLFQIWNFIYLKLHISKYTGETLNNNLGPIRKYSRKCGRKQSFFLERCNNKDELAYSTQTTLRVFKECSCRHVASAAR